MINNKYYEVEDRESGFLRKNLYLKELENLEREKELADKEKKKEIDNKIKQLKKSKKNHPYIIKLQNYKKREREFKINLIKERKSFIKSIDKSLPYKLKNLKIKLFLAEKKCEFYKNYQDLTYDAQLEYETNKILKEELPQLIKYVETETKEIEKLKTLKENIKKEEVIKAKKELKAYKDKEKEAFKNQKKELKQKRKEKIISKKAEKEEIKTLKNKYKEKIMVKSFHLPHKEKRELIKFKKYSVKEYIKVNMKNINSLIAEKRREIPIEVEKNKKIISYVTFLIPGIGQFINTQYKKGILFLIASLFIYLIAIPYALGFSNYQGEGIRGLITLAEGGRRVDKSLIFMIEGIISIFLVIISLLILYFSFKDVLKVEKDMIKGIRPKNWFETKTSIEKEGFPYVSNLPALLLIVFIVLVPVTTTILLSFTGMDPYHQSKFSWIGIKNYRMIFLGEGLAGSVFWLTLGWTIIWTLLATSLAIFIGFSLALLLNNDRIKGKRFFRTIYILPWAVPAFITIMFFSIMVSPNGAITQLAKEILDIELTVKTNTFQTRTALILIQGWLGSSYIFLLSTGVLQAIPSDLYEAADIDGATGFQKLRRITIPIVLYQTAPILVGQYVFNFNNFSIIFLFNGGGPFAPSIYGNLAGSSDLLISYIYKLTIENQYQSIGAAITVLVSIVIMFVSFLGYRNAKAFKEERL